VRLRPWWVAACYLGVVVPADFVMAGQMLRGLRARAEATTAEDVAVLRELRQARPGRHAC